MSTETPETTSELERNLGFLEAMTLGGGTMIGAGIFILPGIAAEGAGPASSISFAIAGFVALLAALSLSELATGMPIAGGSYHYVNRGLGGVFGSIVGWGMWTGLMFASAFYMIGFGQYIVEPIPFFDGRALIVLFGLLGLSLILGINYYGTEESGGAQNIMIGTEFAIIVVYMIAGVFFVEYANLADFAPKGATGVLATTGTVFVTFLGFEIIATVAGEIKEPGRLIPLTMILSVVSVTLLYVILMLISTGVVPWDQLGGSLVPVSDVAEISLGTAGVIAIVFAAVIAAISSSNSSVLAASRVIFAMGRDNLMSNWLNRTHDRFNTPHRAILTTGAVTALLVSLGLEIDAIIALLAEVASFSFLISYALVHISLVVFRRADPPEYDPDFVLPSVLYPIVPILGVLMTGVVISQMSFTVLAVGAGVVALGGIWYGVYARDRDTETGLIRAAIASEADPEATYTVAVPVANPATQRGLIRAAASVARDRATDDQTPRLLTINVIEATSPDQQNVDAERLDNQQALLDQTRDIAAEFDIDIETHAVVATDVGEKLLELIEDLAVDASILGWGGQLNRDEYVFGQHLDAVMKHAPGDVILFNTQTETIGTPVALAGPGPHSPSAARFAVDLATLAGTGPATLLHVQSPVDSGATDPTERGEEAIDWIATRAGLDSEDYASQVVVAEDTEGAIIDAVADASTVCVGLSEKSDMSRILFGSIAELISQQPETNVAIVRGPRTTDEETDEHTP